MIFGVDIRPADRRPLIIAFVVLATITGAHAVHETARDTLFLTNLPATALPWAYIAIAVVSVIISRLITCVVPQLGAEKRGRGPHKDAKHATFQYYPFINDGRWPLAKFHSDAPSPHEDVDWQGHTSPALP